MTNSAREFIDLQDTKFARTDREKAKYLVAKLVYNELPPPRVWWEVLKTANGLEGERGSAQPRKKRRD